MINIFTKDIDLEKYFVVTYFLESKTSLREAAWNLAIGQSIGRMISIRSKHSKRYRVEIEPIS